MIRLAKLTDYGIVLLTHIAKERTPRLHVARDLATETALPPPTVSKLLKALAKGGLLASHRGIHGGYSLARPAEDITVADIIAAIEGPIALTECSSTSTSKLCELEDRCVSKGHLRKISRAIHSALSGLTLAQMAAPPSLPVHADAPASLAVASSLPVRDTP